MNIKEQKICKHIFNEFYIYKLDVISHKQQKGQQKIYIQKRWLAQCPICGITWLMHKSSKKKLLEDIKKLNKDYIEIDIKNVIKFDVNNENKRGIK